MQPPETVNFLPTPSEESDVPAATFGNAHTVSFQLRRPMTKTARVYKIEMRIRNRGHVSFQSLLDELEVSPATLKRDLDYLKDQLGAPIVYDRLLNCLVPCDHVPIRSWPLFRAREIMPALIASIKQGHKP